MPAADRFPPGSVTSRLARPPEVTMADDKSKPGGQDRTRINVNEDYELRDWKVSPEPAYECCVQCHREVPLTTAIAVEVTKDGEVRGYLHRFYCQDAWQAAHPAEYGYGLPRWKSRR